MTRPSKPLASLSASLLARKGAARPAMRPQAFGGFGSVPPAPDDLGWNDMGHMAPEMPSDEAPRIRAPHASVPDAPAKAVHPVSVATATRIRRETNAKHVKHAKAAFTLRLDTDRHLRLRLASALQSRSAQVLVTEALDAFLETLPDVDALLRQLPARAQR